MTQIFLASRNAKKIEEMARILREHLPEVDVLGIDDVEGYEEPVEDQATFEGNALLKARAGYAATGLPSLADDSGLCVDALNGMPGVLSARWSGPPKDDEADLKLPIWAGLLPLETSGGTPESSPDLLQGIDVPAYIALPRRP